MTGSKFLRVAALALLLTLGQPATPTQVPANRSPSEALQTARHGWAGTNRPPGSPRPSRTATARPLPTPTHASRYRERSPQYPTAAQWLALRQCESGNNYAANTGNGFFGAYQAVHSTWGGYAGYPDAYLAPPAVQDRWAQELWNIRRWQPWPACSRKLGFA
jgi:hypothetical protein